jgi:2-methylisocitrate lyase-like PEP mutase family enzyme
MARTDARGSVGFDEAIARCRAFEEEGADILFAEALASEAELAAFGGGFSKATWAKMLPKTPVASRARLKEMGFKIVTYNVLLHAAIRAIGDTLAALAADDPSRAPSVASFEELTSLVGLDTYDKVAERYRVAD